MKRTQNGITLVALVITIIILLILAGISISALTGSGLFGKAKESKQKTVEKTAEEQVKLAIMGSYGQDGKVNLGELKENLNKIPGITEITEETISFPKTVTIDGQEVKIEKKGETITAEAKTGTTTYKAYVVGDEVKLKSDSTEHFYVIKASGENEEKVTLLAAKNIVTSSLTQGDSAGTVAFCTDPDETGEGYWTSISGITYPYDLNKVESERATAINYAKAYGTKYGAEGRLMTVGEVKYITGLTETGTISSPDWIKTTNYWLGSADSAAGVWRVYYGTLVSGLFDLDYIYGVRPVIEISKSLIQ